MRTLIGYLSATSTLLLLASAASVAGCPAAAPAPASGEAADGGSPADAGDAADGGLAADAGDAADGASVADAGEDADGGLAADAGDAADGGSAADGGAAADGGLGDAGVSIDDAGSSDGSTGELWFMTYNVAGLPQGISGSDPLEFMPQISPLLNDYDLVVVQEDFWFHDELIEDVTHPFMSAPSVAEPTLLPPNLGDGLNRFSRYPLGALGRTEWAECNGWTDCANDCSSEKGYSVSEVEIAPGVVVDLYNLHMDAGSCDGDFEARASGAAELAATINARSTGRAVIVAGDTNLKVTRPPDLETLNTFLADTGLEIACRLAECDDESIDRIMIRSGGGIELEVAEWVRPTHFVDAEGVDLSDHLPTSALIRWTVSE